jgi:glycosyltransferase involved in cell wall biosynthesis
LWKYYKNISDRIIITPWGSDVYRVKNIKKILCASCLRRADYVIVDRGIKFESDLLHMYNLDRKKFLYADFGSDIIDLFDKNNITKKEAKFFYNVEGYYVITCGYNANPAQNHKKVIEAIYLIRDKLPENLALFLPMTYGNTVSYKEKITETLESCGFKHVVFSKYMSDKEVLYMKKATDLYINVQNTDAFSSSLQEYILSGTKIINGGWLRYPTIEKFGLPYFVAPDLDSLSDVILKAYNSPRQNINAELINYISSLGWKSMSDDWINIYNNY